MSPLSEETMEKLNERVRENTTLRIEIELLKDAIRNGRSVTGVSDKALKLFGLI